MHLQILLVEDIHRKDHMSRNIKNQPRQSIFIKYE